MAAAATALSAANKIKKKGSVAVQVVVRCRPLNKKEKTEERMPIIEIEATRVHITKTIGNGGAALTKDVGAPVSVTAPQPGEGGLGRASRV